MAVTEAGNAYIMKTSEWVGLQNQFTMYQIGFVVCFLLLLATIILFWPSMPFLWSRFVTHELIVGILDRKTHSIVPTRGFSKDEFGYSYKGQRLDFVKMYPGRFFFAGYPYDVLDFDMATLNDPSYAMMCQKIKEAGYPNIDHLERALLFSQLNPRDPRVDEMIRWGNYNSYEEARLAINPRNIGVHSDVVKMFFTSIPLSVLVGYGAEVPPEDILGEVDDIFEANKPSNKAAKKLREMLPFAIIIIGVCVVGALAYKFMFA